MNDQILSEKNDLQVIEHLNGLYVGQLNEDELAAFDRCVLVGKARRDYGDGAQWLMGLAKVRILT